MFHRHRDGSGETARTGSRVHDGVREMITDSVFRLPPNACGRCRACLRGHLERAIARLRRLFRGANAEAQASGNRERYVNLYVILLCDEVWLRRKFRERNPHYRPSRVRFFWKPCVYVGQTSRDPEKRFTQHRIGYKASPTARKYGICLVPRLYEQLNPVPASEREEREKRLAHDLQLRGYGVWC